MRLKQGLSPEQMLRDVVRELQARGPAYQQHVYLVMRNAYRAS